MKIILYNSISSVPLKEKGSGKLRLNEGLMTHHFLGAKSIFIRTAHPFQLLTKTLSCPPIIDPLSLNDAEGNRLSDGSLGGEVGNHNLKGVISRAKLEELEGQGLAHRGHLVL